MILTAKDITASVDAKTKDLLASAFSERPPQLVILMVGDREDSKRYINAKIKKCFEYGMQARLITFDPNVVYSEVKETIQSLNKDPKVDGILLQLPLPASFIEASAGAFGVSVVDSLINTIDPAKDIDGVTNENVAKYFTGDKTGFVPATPQAIMHILHTQQVPLSGANVVVIGRSMIVGKPVAQLLLHEDAAVTILHSKVTDIRRYTIQADIIIAAVGMHHLITEDMVKIGAAVIDVGMNVMDGKLSGDVDTEAVNDKASFVTKVPGGVGPLTVSFIIQNVALAYYKNNTGKKEYLP